MAIEGDPMKWVVLVMVVWVMVNMVNSLERDSQ